MKYLKSKIKKNWEKHSYLSKLVYDVYNDYLSFIKEIVYIKCPICKLEKDIDSINLRSNYILIFIYNFFFKN